MKNQGRKDDQGKPDFTLVPAAALEDIVRALTYGANKYGADNWRRVKGGRARYFAALMRHGWAYARGESHDAESGLPHLAHAGACILFLLSRLAGDAYPPGSKGRGRTDLLRSAKNS